MYDCIVVGAGPAGMTAALYLLRSNKKVLIIEKNSFGGKIALAHSVENYPGSMKISGLELSDKLLEQITNAGCEIELEEVVSVEKKGGVFTVKCLSSEFEGKTVIIAVGTENRPLGVEKENDYIGRGISYCALCDGSFYKGKTVAVVGGGNTAVQDALMLSETSEKVYLIHRRDEFRAEAYAVDALYSRENITVITNATVSKLYGDNKLSGIEISHNGNTEKLDVSAVFVAIGQVPAVKAFENNIKLDDFGYADSGEDCLTVTDGIFVAGDCRAKSVRQLTTAVSDGTVAAVAAYEYLNKSEK